MLLVNGSGLVSESDIFQAVGAHGDFLFLFAEGLVPNGERVLAGGEILDYKMAMPVGDRKEGVIHHEQVRAHPRMEIAAQLDGAFLVFKHFFAVGRSSGLANVERSVFRGQGSAHYESPDRCCA